MSDKLPQSQAAKDILAALRTMSFDEIMALPVSAEAKDINRILLEMSKCILCCASQYEIGVFCISDLKRNIYIHNNIKNTIQVTITNATNYEEASWQLMQAV